MWKTKPTTTSPPPPPPSHGVGFTFKYIFYLTSVITLTLLVPLSFLLLARLTTANYFLTSTHTTLLLNNPNNTYYSNLITYLFLYTSPTLLHFLVAGVTLSAFVHTLSGHPTLGGESRRKSPPRMTRHKLHLAWICLCVLQVCVGLGIEASLSAGINGLGYDDHDDKTSSSSSRSWLSRLVFFIGLHETMLHWNRTVVKPVVDDTVYGTGVREEKWVERAGMAAACGWLWLLRLRDEVEGIVGVVEQGGRMGGEGIEIGDFVGWWLYYLTVTIGIARVIKGVLWVGMVMFCRKVRDSVEEMEMLMMMEEEDIEEQVVVEESSSKV